MIKKDIDLLLKNFEKKISDKLSIITHDTKVIKNAYTNINKTIFEQKIEIVILKDMIKDLTKTHDKTIKIQNNIINSIKTGQKTL